MRSRRAFLTTASAALVSAIAGCDGIGGRQDSPPDVTGNWPTFQGDALNTGATVGASAADGAVVRSVRVGSSIQAPPAVADGVAYVPVGTFPAGARSGNGGVVAFSLSRWTTRWRAPAASVQTTPTVIDGTVYFGDDAGRIHAVATDTGATQWSTDAPLPESGFEDSTEIRASPTVVDGTLYVGTVDGLFCAFDTADGTHLWTVTVGGSLGVIDAAAVDDGTAFVGSYGGTVHAVDAADGSVRWTYRTPDPGNDYCSAPTLSVDTLYVPTNSSGLRAIDRSSGRLRWHASVSPGEALSHRLHASVALADDTVFVPSTSVGLSTFDAESGAAGWSVESPSFGGPPIVRGSTVYLAGSINRGSDGPLALRALDVSDGTERWRYDTDGRALYGPVPLDDALLLVTNDGTLRLLDLENA